MQRGPGADAIARYGRIAKALHTLRLVGEPGYCRQVKTQASLQEGRHTLARKIFRGRAIQLCQDCHDAMENQVGALGMVLSALVARAGRRSPLPFVRHHVNVLGRDSFQFPRPARGSALAARGWGGRGPAAGGPRSQASNFTFRMVKLWDATKFEDPDSAGRGAGDRAARHHRPDPGGGGRGGRPDQGWAHVPLPHPRRTAAQSTSTQSDTRTSYITRSDATYALTHKTMRA